jgi:hypothetical protein
MRERLETVNNPGARCLLERLSAPLWGKEIPGGSIRIRCTPDRGFAHVTRQPRGPGVRGLERSNPKKTRPTLWDTRARELPTKTRRRRS